MEPEGRVSVREAVFMKEKWKDIISDDPFYNPNLSLDHGYSLDLSRAKNLALVFLCRQIEPKKCLIYVRHFCRN